MELPVGQPTDPAIVTASIRGVAIAGATEGLDAEAVEGLGGEGAARGGATGEGTTGAAAVSGRLGALISLTAVGLI